MSGAVASAASAAKARRAARHASSPRSPPPPPLQTSFQAQPSFDERRGSSALVGLAQMKMQAVSPGSYMHPPPEAASPPRLVSGENYVGEAEVTSLLL